MTTSPTAIPFSSTLPWLKQPNMPSKRRYPPLYEKIIPVTLGIILVAILILLVIVVGVITGLIPYTR